jgi:hypothetical protein
MQPSNAMLRQEQHRARLSSTYRDTTDCPISNCSWDSGTLEGLGNPSRTHATCGLSDSVNRTVERFIRCVLEEHICGGGAAAQGPPSTLGSPPIGLRIEVPHILHSASAHVCGLAERTQLMEFPERGIIEPAVNPNDRLFHHCRPLQAKQAVR